MYKDIVLLLWFIKNLFSKSFSLIYSIHKEVKFWESSNQCTLTSLKYHSAAVRSVVNLFWEKLVRKVQLHYSNFSQLIQLLLFGCLPWTKNITSLPKTGYILFLLSIKNACTEKPTALYCNMATCALACVRWLQLRQCMTGQTQLFLKKQNGLSFSQHILPNFKWTQL